MWLSVQTERRWRRPRAAVRIWALDIDDLLGIAGENVTRTLTDEECRQYLHLDRCAEG